MEHKPNRIWDRETSDDALLAHRSMTVLAGGLKFDLPLSLPLRIDAMLKSEDYDRTEAALTEQAERCIARGTLMAFPKWLLVQVVIAALKPMAAKCLYHLFILRQQQAGNDEWEVPVELMAQKVGA